MNDYENLWPKKDELNKNTSFNTAPYGVLSKFTEALYDAYEGKILGILKASYLKKENQDLYNFKYSLIITHSKIIGVQIKILEMSVTDDGWYPAEIYLNPPKPYKHGRAESEAQLIKQLKEAVNTDIVKQQISIVLETGT